MLRLQINHVDMYLQHHVDPRTPIEKTVQAMVELKKAGKVNSWVFLGVQLGLCSEPTRSIPLLESRSSFRLGA
jgi:predicted oxidoreductase